ncbi:YccF domain-containing protein [Rhodococcus aerolatus]
MQSGGVVSPGAAPVAPAYPGGVRLVLNVIWLVLAGFWLAVGYVVAGLVACVLVVTIPFGIASFRIAAYALWPFGREVVARPTAGLGSAVGNVLWLVLLGWWLALGHVVSAVLLAVTIIGIPLAWANLKLVPVSLLPLGKEIVDSDALVPRYQGAR